jgi:hypothetical protein
MAKVGAEGLGLRAPASAPLGRGAGRRDPALASIEASLQPSEHVEATAYCCAGLGGVGEAGVAALTDRRIVFAPRKGPVRSIPYQQVRAVHHETYVGMQRRIRIALANARPLHLVTGIGHRGADPCEVIRRHTRLA